MHRDINEKGCKFLAMVKAWTYIYQQQNDAVLVHGMRFMPILQGVKKNGSQFSFESQWSQPQRGPNVLVKVH